jgi:hypothetical protein
MSANSRNSRRHVLQVLAGAGGVLAASSVVTLVADTPMPARDALLAVLSDRDGARVLGAKYLDVESGEGNAARLLALVLGGRHLPELTVSAARAFLADTVRQDFERFDTVELDGWVVSRTEARLCALAALS